MQLRPRLLPRGWYPDDPDSLRELVASWAPNPVGGALAAIAPHAGWAFSGRLAARAAASLGAPGGPAMTVVVVGGHLSPRRAPLAAREGSYSSPLGPLAADLELLAALEAELGRAGLPLEDDEEADNTVEVQLPLVAALYPGAKALWIRAPNGEAAIGLGAALYRASTSLGRSVACLGSTDLTHYGPNYGFSPKGLGPAAESWVRETNDKRFVEALLGLDAELALRLGESERSACSSGAAAAAISFARAAGATRAELLGYATSLDVHPDPSFVGYAAVAFRA